MSTKWMPNLKSMVNWQYSTLVVAGYPESFATWVESVDMIRELVNDGSASPVHTRVHSCRNLVEFYGFTPAGRFSINVPFPDEFR